MHKRTQSVITKQEASEYIHYVHKIKGSGMSVQASCSFHFLGNAFRRNEGEKKKQGKVDL